MRPSARTAARYVGIVLATLVVFVIALQLSFPYERVKAKMVDALSEKYDVTVGDVERSWVPGRFSLKALTLRTRPAKADDPVTTFYIERLDVDLHLFAALRGVGSVDLDAKIGGAGHIVGNVQVSKGGYGIHLDGKKLAGDTLPMRELIGLPMSGTIEFAVDVDVPIEPNKLGKRVLDWSLAEGEIDFSCPSGCVIGDGKTKLKPKLKNARSAAFAAEGIEFGKVEIQSLFAEISITPGPGEGKAGKLLLKRFEAKSLDGELKVDFSMAVTPDINESPVAGCLRFKGSDVLNKREPKTFAELQTTGAQLGPDGLFHIKLSEKFREIKRSSQTCGPDANTPTDAPGSSPPSSGNPGTVRRPNLTVTPPPPTQAPPTQAPPAQPPTQAPPTQAPPTQAPTQVTTPPAGSAAADHPSPTGDHPPGPPAEGDPQSGGSAAPAAPSDPATPAAPQP